MSSPRVTALLVVHDGTTWLPEVVASIASQSRSADQILAIDTGSTDASAKLLKGARIPTVTLDRSTSFGKAIQYGITQLPPAIEGVEEWLWILHDDCALDPRALEELLLAVNERPNIAMAGPKLLGWHDRTHLLEMGVSIATNGTRWTGLEPTEYDQGQRDGNHEVLSVSTAGALIRRNVFESLGGFDINLELFRDDVDFGWRVHVAGYSVLAVSAAKGFHAQAASSERRAIDIEGAPLHRPLLLDRRNAAYVLLANSSWWKLPLLALQLLSGALIRSIAFLFAKLPGYASDEILAIASLIIHPRELLLARRSRRRARLVSSGIVGQFIPSRWTQLRSGTSRLIERVRNRIFPDDAQNDAPVISELDISDEDEILQPLPGNNWKTLFSRPLVIAFTILALVTFGWTRYRFGSLSGGALATSPQGASDLFRLYVESWHPVGMGSNLEAPVWTLLLALASTVTLGKPALFISLLFIAAPFLALWSAHTLLKKLTPSPLLSALGAMLYALSPVAISAVNSGRLGIIVLLIAAPLLLSRIGEWAEIEKRTVREIFSTVLAIWFIAAFNPQLIIALLIFSLAYILSDYIAAARNVKDPLFLKRLARRTALLATPLLMLAPTSFQYFAHPSRLLLEIGLQEPGGGANLALLANPGGAGSLPWWSLSPVTLFLLVTFFSTTAARRYSFIGLTFLMGGAFLASLRVAGNGSTSEYLVYSGSFIAIATLMAVIAAVIMFTDLRSRLESTHLSYQHFALALLLVISTIYSATSTVWVFSAGADSPLQNRNSQILPAYLAVEENSKTLVIRPINEGSIRSLSYFISRGTPSHLGEADIATLYSSELSTAVEGVIDSTGVESSKVLAEFGVKYLFVANPAHKELIQTIDGLGGFLRTSSTEEGTVWKVSEVTGRVTFTDSAGSKSALEFDNGAVTVPGPGTITLTDTFSNSWQALADGSQLERSTNQYQLPTFTTKEAGEVLIFHDGTNRRAWISFFIIALVTTIVMAAPAGRRRREISEKEIS
jgi:GT2 family glycosyltransferase